MTTTPLPAGAVGCTSYDQLDSRTCYGPAWRNESGTISITPTCVQVGPHVADSPLEESPIVNLLVGGERVALSDTEAAQLAARLLNAANLVTDWRRLAARRRHPAGRSRAAVVDSWPRRQARNGAAR